MKKYLTLFFLVTLVFPASSFASGKCIKITNDSESHLKVIITRLGCAGLSSLGDTLLCYEIPNLKPRGGEKTYCPADALPHSGYKVKYHASQKVGGRMVEEGVIGTYKHNCGEVRRGQHIKFTGEMHTVHRSAGDAHVFSGKCEIK